VNDGRSIRYRLGALAVCCACWAGSQEIARADSEDTVIQRGLLPERDGRWSLGVGVRTEEPLYRGQSVGTDLLPLIMYEGERAYLRGTRGGLRVVDKPGFQLEAVAQVRLAGYRGEAGTYLDGMVRERALDGGLSAIVPTAMGEFSVDVLADLSNTHRGASVTGSWARTWDFGRLRLRPSVSVTGYSPDLADYYYGIRPEEARPDRPAYLPGSSSSVALSLHSVYRVSTNGYLYGSVGLTRFDESIHDSPLVDRSTQFTAFGGYVYRFGNSSGKGAADATPDLGSGSKWSLRVARGWNAEASLLGIIPGGDLTLSPERTGVVSVEVGKLLDERFQGWPVDIYVKGAYMRYLEQNIQPDGNGVALYIKGFYYGFPWSRYVNTRFGFGQGLSWVDQIPALEQRDLQKKNPNTSRLLCYLDVSIDFSIGDVIRYKPLKNTYLGFAVIHRSGIFGFADMFGSVDGGSNYNSLYVETVF
jgi:outer membrane protein